MEQALNRIVYLTGLAKASGESEAWQKAIVHIADIAIEAIKNINYKETTDGKN